MSRAEQRQTLAASPQIFRDRKGKRNMKKKLLPAKSDYENIFEHPLEWCPLFGYLPKVCDTHLQCVGNKIQRTINVQGKDEDDPAGALELSGDCINIIIAGRIYWGVLDPVMVQGNPAPDIKKLPLTIYHSYDAKCQAARTLFKTLNRLAWNILFPGIDFLENMSARSLLKRTMHDIVDSRVFSTHFDAVFNKCQRIKDSDYKISEIEFNALCSILISWSVLVAMCADKKNVSQDLLSYKAIRHADELLQRAEVLTDKQEKENTRRLLEQKIFIEEKRQEASRKAKKESHKKNTKKTVEESYHRIKWGNSTSYEDLVGKIHKDLKETISRGSIRNCLEELKEEKGILLPLKKNTGPRRKD